jgi:hypothetical protein
MDRLKADFIVSLPMQPNGCPVTFFNALERRRFVP